MHREMDRAMRDSYCIYAKARVLDRGSVWRLLALQQLGDNLIELSVHLLELGRRLECRLQGLDSGSNALEVKLDESQVLQVRDEREIGGSEGRSNDVLGLLEVAAVVVQVCHVVQMRRL